MKMQVKTMPVPYNGKSRKMVTEHQVDLALAAEDLENTMGGKTVVCVDVNRADGKTARFWLSVRICGDSRVGKPGTCYGTVSSRRNGKDDPSKQVSASWIDFAVRKASLAEGGAK